MYILQRLLRCRNLEIHVLVIFVHHTVLYLGMYRRLRWIELSGIERIEKDKLQRID